MKMPVVFIGHGSPMNAIETNAFTEAIAGWAKRAPRPKAILCVSAHWMTEGTWVTRMARPKTIHDFYGFPKPLFDVQYPAPGAPALAEHIRSLVKDPKIHGDDETWGLDHGSWAVLRQMYPEADVPTLQLSLYLEQPGDYHYRVGQQLRALRDEGVLIVGSGNIVHNLRRIRWEEDAKPFEWAVVFDEWVKERLEKRDYRPLIDDYLETPEGKLSCPTPDHYYPLLTVLGASDESDPLAFIHEEIQNSSISMRSLSLG